jgi:3-phenylpropionate/trans-cinnamate dioxygenase ferredoxin subunit
VSAELRIPAGELTSGQAKRYQLGSVPVCVVRIGEDFYAIGDTCSHANFSLSDGEVDSEECSIECWKHGSAFSLVDGKPRSLPATKPVPVYPVRVDGTEVVVKLP